MASEWVKEIYSPYSPLVYRRCVLSLGCSKTLTITIIEKKAATFRFIVVAVHGLYIEDVILSLALACRSYIGAKSLLNL